MRVGIEAKVLDPAAGGIGRYAVNLVRALQAIAADEGLELVLFTGPRSRPALVAGGPGPAPTVRRLRLGSSVLRSLVSLPAALARERLDVFHGLDHVGIPLRGRAAGNVITVHDILPVELPGLFPRKHRLVVRAALRRALRRADRIIVPSRAVRGAILGRFGIPEARIRVIPEGCEPRFSPRGTAGPDDDVRQRYGLPGRYALFVGTREPRKNLERLIEGFARATRDPRFDRAAGLVIAGPEGWGPRRLAETAARAGIADRLVVTGWIEDDDLPALYRGARLFVYPSLREGFGLPVLEAMGCGTPVVCSRTAALSETAGGAAVEFDPCDPVALAGALVRAETDEALRRTLRERGLARARELSWSAAARGTLEVYREAAAAPAGVAC